MCSKKAKDSKPGKKPTTWDLGNKDVGNLERTKPGDGPQEVVADMTVSGHFHFQIPVNSNDFSVIIKCWEF